MPVLAQCEMLMPAAIYTDAGFSPETPLLQMPDFNSLIASSQEHQVPIFELTPAQLEQQGRVLANTQASQDQFRILFKEASERVLQITGG